MSLPRFIAKVEDNIAYLEDEELHHAIKVKRLKEGDLLEINDLQGNIYKAKIIEINKKYAKLEIIEKIQQEEEKLKTTLYLAVPYQLSKIDEIIDNISQLGVYKFVPVITKNCAIKEQDVIKKLEKWKKIAIQSIKQCKRVYPVVIEKPIKLDKIIDNYQLKIVFYEKEREKSLHDIEMNKDITDIAVVIGNEGGFTEEEINLLLKKGFQKLKLCNNILRMETAIIVGICQINFKFGG
ncbi:16S rRNA (uracil(1498)-N(3))-methyltransferase [Venenivibrio stagnispumantis]|uniref:Ribosomal RNA small subunit methyltransferase E n=1 Tax=Venenivibrio stagnispumantis TaxID=407998 RepID=A0AA46AFM6_9AQUI|nr:RsmE family RNA methyltransferase [Venenivibrio stagnispumantis]MCW4573389.1 16S rRNA (uracil(1498)-N(3))-methyltransferase [Venenivibrio stagnispumantis]SMP20712.1 16S rRNA (uracil1498-N3)-methyltransferase [Venenivibrio stagnispumantis]